MSSMGMDKSGNQTIGTNVWTKLTSWTARSGYGSTVITSDTLVMNTTGTGDIRFLGNFTGAFGTQQFRVVKNGVTVLGTAANTGVTTTISAQTVNSGDTLELQGLSSSGFQQVVAGGSTSTFLEFNQTVGNQNVDGTRPDTWGITGALLLSAVVAAARAVTWGVTGSIGLQAALDGTRPVTWGRTGTLTLSALADAASTRNWGIAGTLALSRTVAGATTDVWGISGTISRQLLLDGATTRSWGIAGAFSVQKQLDGTRTTTWGRTGSLVLGPGMLRGTRQISWGITGGITVIRKPQPLPTVFGSGALSISIHTADGRIVGSIPCEAITNFSWSREGQQVTSGTFDMATEADVELAHSMVPWVHWVTMFHDQTAVWTGPIQLVEVDADVTSVTAKDPATFMWRTRVPITKTWTDTDPVDMADELWSLMYERHGIRATPVLIPSVAKATFTISAVSDQTMLHALMDSIVNVGLNWTVIAGRPVLGTFPKVAVAELEECDFTVRLKIRRDGSQTFNDVRVQGQNWAQTAISDLYGLHLQSLVSLNDLKGVSNIQRATEQYAADSAQIFNSLSVPASATLHPEAPVSLDDLVPGKIFAVHTTQVSQLMRLKSCSVSGTPSSYDVQVTLVALPNTDELATLIGGNATI